MREDKEIYKKLATHKIKSYVYYGQLTTRTELIDYLNQRINFRVEDTLLKEFLIENIIDYIDLFEI